MEKPKRPAVLAMMEKQDRTIVRGVRVGFDEHDATVSEVDEMTLEQQLRIIPKLEAVLARLRRRTLH